jgi:hypothetical protein
MLLPLQATHHPGSDNAARHCSQVQRPGVCVCGLLQQKSNTAERARLQTKVASRAEVHCAIWTFIRWDGKALPKCVSIHARKCIIRCSDQIFGTSMQSPTQGHTRLTKSICCESPLAHRPSSRRGRGQLVEQRHRKLAQSTEVSRTEVCTRCCGRTASAACARAR